MILDIWARQWGIDPRAIADLKAVLNISPTSSAKRLSGMSEAAVQQRIRMDAPGHRTSLWRNNIGMAMDKNGTPIRFGLGNDSPQTNKTTASSDLIGITEHVVTPADVGHTVGLFTSVEAKRGDWVFQGTPREQAQLRWNLHIISRGGIGVFATCPEDVWPIKMLRDG